MRLTLLSTIILCLFSCLRLTSQIKEKNYLFKSITIEEGLSNNIIYDILQDKEGYIWVATDNGLNRYDGYSTKKFFHKATDSSTISSSVIRSLIEDSNDNLWVGTKNGLNLYDKKTQKFKQIIELENSGALNLEVMRMYLDGNGNIWLCTLNDIVFFNPITLNFKIAHSSARTPYMSMAISDDKVYLIKESGEMSLYDVNTDNSTIIVKDSLLIKKAIYFGNSSGKLWLPFELGSSTGITNQRSLPRLPNGLEPNNLLEIDTTTLLIGTNEGLFEYDASLKELKKINLGQSTLVQQIRCIYKDHFGGIWIGTLGGIFHYDSHRKVFEHLDFEKDSDDIVIGIHANSNGIYANTLGKGVYYKPFDSNEIKSIKLPNSISSQNLFVWDIEEVLESHFKIWLATNDGLLCYDPIQSNFYRIELPNIDSDKKICFSILNSSEDNLWVSTYRAIHRISKKERKVLASYPFTRFMEHSGIQKLEALGNFIFIATEGEGLFRFDKTTHKISKVVMHSENEKNHLFKTPIWDLHANEETLWIGTNQGLYNLTLENAVIKPILEDDQIIFSIIQDDKGVLWMGSDKGLKTYDPSNEFVRYYNTENGLKNTEFNRKSVTKTIDGNLWFGGVNGITSFNPTKIKKNNPNKPYLHITNLEIVTSDSTFSVPHFQKKIVLPWKHNTIEISYVGLNYTNTSQNNYKYKMEGYDPNWVSSNKPDKARYVRLPVGTYMFNVTAANNDNVWNTDGDAIEIKITPPLWRTKTAYILYVLATIGLINLVRRLRKYRNRIVEVELEKELIAKKVDRIAIILNNKSKVYLKELKYIKSDGNYLEFVTEKKKIIDRNKLKAILELLPPNFIRVHRSYVINKNYINSHNSTSIIVNPNIEIPLSRTFKANLQ